MLLIEQELKPMAVHVFRELKSKRIVAVARFLTVVPSFLLPHE